MELRLIGYSEHDFPEDLRPLLNETGPYSDDVLLDLLAESRADVIWFPAAWPETYSFTLSAALAAEMPIVATNIGAFSERLAGRPLTWLGDPNSTTEQWIKIFSEVRAELQQAGDRYMTGKRRLLTDFYKRDYLPPASSSSTDRAPYMERRPGQLRRSRRPSVVIIPERLANGILSPCAYIRLLQPIDHFSNYHDIDIVVADIAEALHYTADLFITQRLAPGSQKFATELVRRVRELDAKLIYDIDDDLTSVPEYHVDVSDFRPRANLARYLIKAASHVWTSTPALAAKVRRTQTGVTVIPNGLDERIWSAAARPRSGPRFGPTRILYMGTATHDRDMDIVGAALEHLKEDFGERVEIDVIGVTGRSELPCGVNRIAVPANAGVSYPAFVNWISHQPAWDVGIAPLEDSAFNRCKSAIKCLDYAALGLATVASDIPVYQGSLADGRGGLLVRNEAWSWYRALSRLIRDKYLLRDLQLRAREEWHACGTLFSQEELRRTAWKTLDNRL